MRFATSLSDEEHLPLYYFLQTVLRYCLLSLSIEEQCLASITKLVNTLPSEEIENSTFYLVIKSAYESDKECVEHITMLHFLSMLESIYKTETKETLKQKVSEIRKNYRVQEKLAG